MSEITATTPAPTVWPSVGFSDVEAGVRLLGALGFVVTVRYDGADGTVEHAEARGPAGGGIMFGTRGKPGDWGSRGPQGVYVVAEDAGAVGEAFARVADLPGVEVLRPLHDTDAGSRGFDIRGPDGNLWSVGTDRGAPGAA